MTSYIPVSSHTGYHHYFAEFTPSVQMSTSKVHEKMELKGFWWGKK